jgi:hypothetical protein
MWNLAENWNVQDIFVWVYVNVYGRLSPKLMKIGSRIFIFIFDSGGILLYVKSAEGS